MMCEQAQRPVMEFGRCKDRIVVFERIYLFDLRAAIEAQLVAAEAVAVA